MILFLVCLLLLPGLGWGFDRIAHESIGYIAENRLSPSTLKRIREIIGPDQSLASVSTWADEIRPHRPETRPWHYINLPAREEITEAHISKYCRNNDCVIAQIQISVGILTDPSQIKRRKAEALKFLVHFVGDIHQPLHCADDGDRGGNDKLIRFQGKRMDLHALWDRLITKENNDDSKALAKRLEAGVDVATAGKWSQGNETTCCLESWRIAKEVIYKGLGAGPRDLTEINLGNAYFKRMRPIVEEQLQKAGVRLAQTLESIFGSR